MRSHLPELCKKGNELCLFLSDALQHFQTDWSQLSGLQHMHCIQRPGLLASEEHRYYDTH
jgi:hypothetical protein